MATNQATLSQAFDVDAVVDALAADGYAIVPGVLSEDECARYRDLLDRAAAYDVARGKGWLTDGGANQRIWSLLTHGEEFVRFAAHPDVLAVMEGTLDAGCYLGTLNANILGPGGLHGLLHCDQGYMPDPFEYTVSVNTLWMIDDFTEDNGATRFVPGSHRRKRSPRGAEPEAPRAVMTGAAGSVAFIDGRLWHQAWANRSTGKRRAVFAYYNRSWVRCNENYALSLPKEMLERHPELEAICGMTRFLNFNWVDSPPMDELPPTESEPPRSSAGGFVLWARADDGRLLG